MKLRLSFVESFPHHRYRGIEAVRTALRLGRTVEVSIMVDKNANARISDSKTVLRPVLGLVEGLDPSQLRDVTIDAILKHRALRDEASASHLHLQDVLSAQARPEEVRFAERGYIGTMIALHAHQTALSTLLDALGYIPEVPPQQLSN
ncbi:hypothetical protein ASG50_25055 [Rhizobium sp. Leaf386]|nr:hypothetical protein ASG50_25055 [Rhizobium sp. Leaf386]